jgi:hypothetical protein
MQLTVSPTGRVAVVTLKGELDIADARSSVRSSSGRAPIGSL